MDGRAFPRQRGRLARSLLSAMAVLLRIFWGGDPRKDRGVITGTRVLLKNLPVWDEQREGAIDPLTWYYGTLAIFRNRSGG